MGQEDFLTAVLSRGIVPEKIQKNKRKIDTSPLASYEAWGLFTKSPGNHPGIFYSVFATIYRAILDNYHYMQ